MGASGPSGGDRGSPPVYVFPCRIQQGSGEWFETARALEGLERAGHRLLYLLPRPEDPTPKDPRAQPLDPTRAGPGPFPKILPVTDPVPAQWAVAVVTWYGLTAEREDARGSPNPGPFAPRFERLRQSYPRHLLVLSLEEFGTGRTSRAALLENRRQSGVVGSPRSVSRHSQELYHAAFVAARAGGRGDVLHLVPEFSPDLPALQEFPFLLPLPPFGERAPVGHRGSPSRTRTRLSVLWYAHAQSSARILPGVLRGLEATGRRVLLLLRSPDGGQEAPPHSPPGSRVEVRRLGPVLPRAWGRLFREADLRIVGGSQTLLEAWNHGGPFLYFNGCLEGPGGKPVGFRREKLLSLLRRWPTAGRSTLRRDLRDFADGRRVEPIVRRALASSAWRSDFLRERRGDREPYPPGLRPSAEYLRRLVEGYAESGFTAERYVRSVRRRHRDLLAGKGDATSGAGERSRARGGSGRGDVAPPSSRGG